MLYKNLFSWHNVSAMTKRGFVVSIATIISLVLILSGLNHVAEGNGNGADARILNFEQIGKFVNSIPGFIADFVNSLRPADLADDMKQAGANLFDSGSDPISTIDWSAPSRIGEAIDNWLLEATGLQFTDIIKGVARIVIWFLETALAIFRGLLSLFE